MTTESTGPGDLSFAHLAGVGQLAAPVLPAAAASDPPAPDDDDEGKDKDRMQRDDEDDDDYKARIAAMDEKDDDDEKGNASALAARSRERARCAAIFASPAAGRNPVLAANLAFGTSLPRGTALTLLAATPPPSAATGNPGRAARNPNVGAGASTAVTSGQAVASRWDVVLSKTGAKKR